ncbi:hypothetical protein SISNIDRAFT_495750 [Sistotremastrum niveocremeum HHB9708]|uniref:F-box domain-containing protein n=2 Tax=Sistotremastraceae TaxID=3402574 RepID=A0A164UA03_9AGAM|nr:hypothetical protein SISNIDRAFT_495750 [Sistotremastrum niveocremeum HHB9708]KZT44284.1 hypothetical protein SISSUDRAFT_1012376 [Sistotremastrum suecicum HHB10207 ss-3]
MTIASVFEHAKRELRTLFIEPNYFLSLPQDVVLEICHWLEIRDILILRCVDRNFYALTHEAIIWKRLLTSSSTPLPPMPPTNLHTLDNLSAAFCEQTLKRAYRAELEWNHGLNLPVYHSFDASCFVQSIALLPGGKYSVVVAREPSNGLYYLVLWEVDRLDSSRRFCAIARTVLSGPATELQAQYMIVDDAKCIVVALDTRDANQSGNTFQILGISLESIEHFSVAVDFGLREFEDYPNIQPFYVLHRRRHQSMITSLTLETIHGKPCVAFVRNGTEIMMQNISSGRRVGFAPINPFTQDLDNALPLPLTCSVKSITILSAQKLIFVVREVVPTEESACQIPPRYLFEFYQLPRSASEPRRRLPLFHSVEQNVKLDFVQVFTTRMTPTNPFDSSFTTSTITQQKPPSILIRGGVSVASQSLQAPMCYVRQLHPVPLDPYEPAFAGNINYRYLPDQAPTGYYWRADEFPSARPLSVYGGITRSFWVMGPDGKEAPEVCGLVRFSKENGADGSILDNPARHLQTIPLPGVLLEDLQRGPSTIAFDEGSSRLCIATAHNSCMHVVDFTHLY